MVDMIERLKTYGNNALWFGKETGKAVVGTVAETVKEPGGVRALAGGTFAAIGLMDHKGFDTTGLQTIKDRCADANAGLGVLHIVNVLNDFATGKAQVNTTVLISKICFLVKDTLTALAFLEKCALIAAGTAQNCVSKLTGWTGISLAAESVGKTFEYHGWAFSAVHHLSDWQNAASQESKETQAPVGYWNSLSKNRALELALDATKLLGIGLMNSPQFKTLQYLAFIGQSTVAITRGGIKYFDSRAAQAA